jgi:hypothetical protein
VLHQSSKEAVCRITSFSFTPGWEPSDSDLEEIGRHVALGEDAICTLREIVEIADRPRDIKDEEAMRFFVGAEGDTELSQGEAIRDWEASYARRQILFWQHSS